MRWREFFSLKEKGKVVYYLILYFILVINGDMTILVLQSNERKSNIFKDYRAQWKSLMGSLFDKAQTTAKMIRPGPAFKPLLGFT